MKVDAIIFCPIEEEHDAFLMRIQQKKSIKRGNQFYTVGKIKTPTNKLNIVLSLSSKGNATLPNKVHQANKHFKSNLMVLAGTAGGLRKVKVGDIVIANQGFNYESGKVIDEGILSSPKYSENNTALLQYARSTKKETENRYNCKVFVGAIASGEKSILSRQHETYKIIRERFERCIAIDMEAYGFYSACNAIGGSLEFLNVRCVSDLLDNKLQQNALGSKEMAAERIADYTIDLLATYLKRPMSNLFSNFLKTLPILLFLAFLWYSFHLMTNKPTGNLDNFPIAVDSINNNTNDLQSHTPPVSPLPKEKVKKNPLPTVDPSDSINTTNSDPNENLIVDTLKNKQNPDTTSPKPIEKEVEQATQPPLSTVAKITWIIQIKDQTGNEVNGVKVYWGDELLGLASGSVKVPNKPTLVKFVKGNLILEDVLDANGDRFPMKTYSINIFEKN